MTKFNRKGTKPRTRSPIRSSGTRGYTHNYAPAFGRDAKSELFLMSVGSFFGESTFYEATFNERYKELASKVAIEDPVWLTGFVRWLRKDVGIRSAPIAIALEGVHARIDEEAHGYNRPLILAALQRGDEPGEAFSYWYEHFGKPASMPLKRAVADWFEHYVNEYQYVKYGDSRYKGFSHQDLVRLTSPRVTPGTILARKPSTEENADVWAEEEAARKNALLAYIADPESVPAPKMVALQKAIFAGEIPDPTPEQLKASGITWQQYASFTGTKPDWNKLIPSLGYQALLMNLRNIESAGIKSPNVRARIADPVEVQRSRMFPFRFLAAYKELPGFYYTDAVNEALEHSTGNIPALDGFTLVLVDQSGSMYHKLSEHSKMSWRDTSAIFGAAVARAAKKADLVEFANGSRAIERFRNTPLLRLVNEQFGKIDYGDTKISEAIRSHLRPTHTRLIIITDEQGSGRMDVPTNIPVYVWSLVGYRYGFNASQENVHVFGGLSDKSFKLIQLIEDGRNANWPWETI